MTPTIPATNGSEFFAVETTPRLAVRRADLALVRRTRWAWRGRIPLGYLSILLGAEGSGKGTLWPWIVAGLTRGSLDGDLDTPGRVLVIGDEDGFDSVVVPRCHAVGADLGFLDVLDDGGNFDIHRDAEQLRDVIVESDYRLVIFDALLDTFGLDVDDWRSKQVRGALRPIRMIARDLDVAMLACLHPNKGQRGTFRDLLSGSHAFNALSRSSLLLAPHPDDETRRVLVRGKGNLSATPPSFEFSIEGRELPINGERFSVPVLTDPVEGELAVSDVIRPRREAPVREKLADEIDKLGTGEIQRRTDIAQAVGCVPNDRTVDRALNELEARASGGRSLAASGNALELALAHIGMCQCPIAGPARDRGPGDERRGRPLARVRRGSRPASRGAIAGRCPAVRIPPD